VNSYVVLPPSHTVGDRLESDEDDSILSSPLGLLDNEFLVH
jgi:hypothetical protein